MNLEVGMYVRTKYGIHKISEIDERKTVYKYICDYRPHEDGDGTYTFSVFGDKDIVKASHKIEKLLKKGDYVNGYMITDFGTDYYDEDLDEDIEGFSIVLGNEEQYYRIPPKDIETVMTKEQFESMAYKVGA